MKTKIVSEIKKNKTSIYLLNVDNVWRYKNYVIKEINNEINYKTVKGGIIEVYDNNTKIRTLEDKTEDDNLGNLPVVTKSVTVVIG